MVAFISELVASPGKTSLVCDALEAMKRGSVIPLQQLVAVAKGASRSVLVMHVCASEAEANQFEDVILPELLESMGQSLDQAPLLRRFEVAGPLDWVRRYVAA